MTANPELCPNCGSPLSSGTCLQCAERSSFHRGVVKGSEDFSCFFHGSSFLLGIKIRLGVGGLLLPSLASCGG
jgi:hypothetical protein